MRLALLAVVGSILVGSLPVHAQTMAEVRKEAEIKRSVPYATMREKIPGMTLQDYNETVRALARQELGLDAPAVQRRRPYATIPSIETETTTAIGSSTFSSSSDGVTGTTQRIGNTSFYSDSTGTSATAITMQPFTFYTVTPPAGSRTQTTTGTSTHIGTSSFHTSSDGVSGTSTQIGNTTFHNFSNGKNCTSTTIGTTVFTNCSSK